MKQADLIEKLNAQLSDKVDTITAGDMATIELAKENLKCCTTQEHVFRL